jgi:AbrB family looped-hinge helix DNA binding protein
MAPKIRQESGCASQSKDWSCCRVESIVTVDERGQMVLPKEIRERAKIRAGDKLAVVTWEKEEAQCCIVLIRAEQIMEMVKELLGPLVKELTEK